MKKLVYTLVVAVLVMALSMALIACGGDNEDTTTPSTPDTQVPPSDDGSNEGSVPEQDPSGGLIPAEAMKKINEIYKKSTIEAQTVTTVQQLAILTSISYTIAGCGPISVTTATLNGEEITLITLGGTEFVDGQATTIEESKLASEGKMNDYLRAVIKVFDDGQVPNQKPVIVAGISLGGMIAQQVIGVDSIMDNYTIKAVITFGSPLTMPLDRHGVKVVRFADKHDMVPKSGEINLSRFPENKGKVTPLQKSERLLETSKYRDPITTHALSYIEDECWNKYDFLGAEAGTNTLVLKSKMTFYHAPKLTPPTDK